MAVILNTLYTKKSNIKLVTEIIVSWKWKFCRENSESWLLNSWFSKLPLGIYSYTNSLCSSSQQYPISFTRCACLNCPRNITSVCKPESNNMIKTEESINHQVIISHYPAKKILTNHSLCPCDPSKSKNLTATGWAAKPGLSLSSMNPLWTGPKPPSPIKLLDEKLCVITFSSPSVNTWRLEPARDMERSSESVVELGLLKSESESLWNEVCFATTFALFWGARNSDL